MFQDPDQSGVVVVTIPEDMPTNETVELIDALREELGLPVARMVVNMVMEELFSAQERTQLLAPRKLDPSQLGDVALASGVRRSIRERVQTDSLVRLGEIDVDRLRLPQLYDDAANFEAVEQLSKLF